MPEEPYGLGLVFHHAQTVDQQMAQVAHRLCIALVSCPLGVANGLRELLCEDISSFST